MDIMAATLRSAQGVFDDVHAAKNRSKFFRAVRGANSVRRFLNR